MKARVKSLLAEYEIGFVTHGKDVNEHLKKFESALDTLFTEQMKKVIGEDVDIEIYDPGAGEAINEEKLEQRQRLEESRNELFR